MTNARHDLSAYPFFSGIQPDKLRSLLEKAEDIKKNPGEFIFHEGERAEKFFIVTKGRVALELFSAPKGPVIVETIQEGEVLGWSWLIAPHRWRFDALALESVELIALDAKTLWDRCESDHELGYSLLKKFLGVVTERLEATRIRLLDLYSAEAAETKK